MPIWTDSGNVIQTVTKCHTLDPSLSRSRISGPEKAHSKVHPVIKKTDGP